MSDKPIDKDDGTFTTAESNTVDHVFKTIRLVTTLFPALVLILVAAIGFLGISSIGTAVDLRIGAILSSKQGEMMTLSESLNQLNEDVKTTQSRLEQLTGDVDSAVAALEYYSSDEYDPVGRLLNLQVELSRDGEVVLNNETRKRAEIVFSDLLRLSEPQEDPNSEETTSIIDRQVDAELLFNASGTASEFNMPQFASKLAEGAWKKKPTPEHTARMYRAKVATGELSEGDALGEILAIVRKSDTTHQLHLTLSEAANIANNSDQSGQFIDALDEIKTVLGARTPSYVWIVQSKSLLIRGSRADTERAIRELETGLDTALAESPLAYWFDSSVEEAGVLLNTLENHPSFRESSRTMQDRFREILKARPNEEVGGLGTTSELPTLQGSDPFSTALTELIDTTPPTETELIYIVVDEPEIIAVSGWNWFGFRVQRFGDYRIHVESGSAEVDPVVLVFDSFETLVGLDDDGGAGLDSLLDIRLEEDDYLIAIGSASSVSDTVQGATVWIERVR